MRNHNRHPNLCATNTDLSEHCHELTLPTSTTHGPAFRGVGPSHPALGEFTARPNSSNVSANRTGKYSRPRISAIAIEWGRNRRDMRWIWCLTINYQPAMGHKHPSFVEAHFPTSLYRSRSLAFHRNTTPATHPTTSPEATLAIPVPWIRRGKNRGN
jgi:hypothetical protein